MIAIVESNYGAKKAKESGLEPFIIKGSKHVNFHSKRKTYSITGRISRYIANYAKKNGNIVFLATDADTIGTKIATIYKKTFNKMGVESIRTPVSNKGVIKVGTCYNDRSLNAFKKIDNANIETSKKIRKKYSLPFSCGFSRAVVIGAVASIKEKSFPVKKSGTNTITALVKGSMQGNSFASTMQKITDYYTQGKIEYPRVDNDYIEDGLDVYAHPALKLDVDKAIMSPFDTDELPVNKDTVILFLNQHGLISPSMAVSYKKTIDIVFEDNLKPKEEFKDFVNECQAIYEKHEGKLENLLTVIHPKMELISIPSPAEAGISKNSEKEKREEYFKLIRQAEEIAYRKREKEKEKEKESRKKTKEAPSSDFEFLEKEDLEEKGNDRNDRDLGL